jgi:hypothetical protein
MSMRTWMRAAALAALIGLAAVGCDKAASTGTSGAGKPAEESYSKKLVGVWEGEPEKLGDKDLTMTIEFKADNTFKMAAGPFEFPGTWKVAKEDGKTVTIETEVEDPFGAGKDKKASPKKDTFTIAFEDANTMTMSKDGPKPDPKKMKRKS